MAMDMGLACMVLVSTDRRSIRGFMAMACMAPA
jgi:hypothetical protein